MNEVLQRIVLGNSLLDWAISAAIVLAAMLGGQLVRAHLGKIIRKISERTTNTLDDKLAEVNLGPIGSLVFLWGVHLAGSILVLPAALASTLRSALLVAAGVLVCLLGLRLIDLLFRGLLEPWAERTKTQIDDLLVGYGRKLLKILVVLLIAVAVLEQVGFDVVSIVTGMGIGGLAVALAAQETLGNVLGSIQILTDQPFAVGDWIRVDGHLGEVRDIGLRSTKIRTYNRALVVIPNRQIAEVAIENLTVGNDLAVDLKLGLVYNTSPEQMERAREILLEVIRAEEGVGDNPLVHFLEFADSALTIRCTYFVRDFSRFWAIQHEVNMKVKRRFDSEGLEFAFQTRTVHLVQ